MKQGRDTLLRDFPKEACVFRNVLEVLPVELRNDPARAKPKTFETHARCDRHGSMCQLPCNVDLCVFGAPCVDDSSIGSLRTDDGDARFASWLQMIMENLPPTCS